MHDSAVGNPALELIDLESQSGKYAAFWPCQVPIPVDRSLEPTNRDAEKTGVVVTSELHSQDNTFWLLWRVFKEENCL